MENINMKNILLYNHAIKQNICRKHTHFKTESPASRHLDLFSFQGEIKWGFLYLNNLFLVIVLTPQSPSSILGQSIQNLPWAIWPFRDPVSLSSHQPPDTYPIHLPSTFLNLNDAQFVQKYTSRSQSPTRSVLYSCNQRFNTFIWRCTCRGDWPDFIV
jgi:hypothetical protein